MTVVPLPLVPLPVSRDCFVLALAPNAVASALTDLVRDCNGVVAIEFLIMLGPLLLLLLGTFDIGLMTLSETRINFAVEAAAKCGAIGAAMCISPSQTAAYGSSIAGFRASMRRVFWSRRKRVECM